MSKITSEQIAAQEAWITPSLATGWTQFDAGSSGVTTGRYGTARYFKDTLGIVHMDGLIVNNSGATKNNITGKLIFTLPAGYRPYHLIRVIVPGQDVLQEVDIELDGTIVFN
jgi:hypothetical protein